MSSTATARDAMFYFGPTTRQLYGVLHESQTYAQREHGIVLCYPFGNEYPRSHRAFRQLALQLARQGFPVLRFDYGGTGDSVGEPTGNGLLDWRLDIAAAVTELIERTGVERICIAGLRLGASLAMQVAQVRDDVSALILWEPIVDGQTYLDELADQHREMLWRFFDNPDPLEYSTSGECLGTPLGERLRDEIEQVDLLATPLGSVERVCVIASESQQSFTNLDARIRESSVSCDYRLVPSFLVWREDIDKGLVPDAVLREISAWAIEALA